MTESATSLTELREKSLLALVPGLMEMALLAGNIRLFAAGATVASSGSPVQFLTIPMNADLALMAPGSEKSIGRLKRRQSLALGEMLSGKPYAYTAITETDTRVFFLSVARFLECLTKHPEIHHYLKLVTQSPGARSLKSVLTGSGLGKPDVIKILSNFGLEPLSIPSKTACKPVDGFLWLLESGMVRVTHGSGSARDLGPGAWFGGQALVAPYQVSYSVEAIEDTLMRRASLDTIRPQLEKLGMIEPVQEEPWANRGLAWLATQDDGELSELPGSLIDPKDPALAKLGVNIVDIKSAKSNTESIGASIVNICSLLKAKVNLSNIETGLQLRPSVTFARIATLLEPMGFHTSCRKGTFDRLHQHVLPALLQLGPRLVVLIAVDLRRKLVILLDPARGAIRVRRAEFEPIWNGLLLEVGLAFEREPDSGTNRASRETPAKGLPSRGRSPASRLLINQLLGEPKILFNLASLILLTTGLRALQPLFLQHILNSVLTTRDAQTLWTCVAGILLTSALAACARYFAELVRNEFGLRIDQRLSSSFYGHAMTLPSRALVGHKTGTIMNQLQALTRIKRFLSGPSIDAMIGLAFLPFYLIILGLYSPWMAAIGLAAALGIAIGQSYFCRLLAPYYERSFELDSAASTLISEQISSIAAIKANRSEKQMLGRWEDAFVSFMRLQREQTDRSTSVQSGLSLQTAMAQTGCLWLCCYLVLRNELTPGAIFAISQYLSLLTTALSRLGSLFTEWVEFDTALTKVSELLETPAEESATRAGQSYSFPLQGRIKLDEISFRYETGSPWALKDMSLTIYPRQIVAIVGRSGCGKSTLANLIAGNIRPTTGRIFYDDFDSSFLSASALRNQVGYIMQSSDLIGGTIAENIAFDDDAPNLRDTVASASHAGAHDFISRLPGGYNYRLAEGGVGLSGGEKQRVCMARTLYRQPRILILDEATSSLDAATERTLVNKMREMFEGKTAIIIAHRLSTIRQADRILVMDQGRIVEDGSHRDLVAKQGHYARLFRNQLVSSQV